MRYRPLIAVLFLLVLSQAQAFTLSGRILEKGTKAPLSGAVLVLEPMANTPEAKSKLPGVPAALPPSLTPTALTTQTDLKGHYEVTVSPGSYSLVAAAEGYKKSEINTFEIRGDLIHDFYLEPEGFTLPEVVVTASKAPKTEVSHEVLSKDELSSVAGSVGDVLRSVQTLPGVINAGIEYGGLLVRGSGPYDNLYLVDRIPVAFPFHFGGAISTLDSNLIQDLDFIGGGLPPPYATVLGGVVDVTQRDPRLDRWGFRADVNMLMSEAEAEGPLTSDSSLVLAGRRSYLDLLISSLNNSTFTAVPVFGDYQGKLAYNPSPNTHWDFVALGSDDTVGVKLNGDFAAQDPILGGQFNFNNGYHSQGLNYRQNLDGQNTLWNTLYHSYAFLDESFGGGLYLDSTLEDWGDWFTYRHDFDENDRLEAGLQYDYLINGTNAYFVIFPAEYNDPGFLATLHTPVAANDTLASSDFGAYFDQSFKWFEKKLELSVGARADYLTYISQAAWGPRFSAAYLLSDNTTLKASYGYAHEAPSRIEGNTYLDPALGNPLLGPEQSISTVVGVEQKLDQGLLLRVEGYEKDFSQMIVYATWPTNYTNAGTGTARGIEIFLRRELTDRFFGWISYSLSDSRRQDSPLAATYLYDFNEPNNLQVVANYKINPGWDAGFKFLYASGLPYTPVFGNSGSVTTTVNNTPVTVYIPITGLVNSRRLPDYVRLDLSTSIKTTYDTWEWRFYLEIINALDSWDVLGYQYNGDYTLKKQILDLPFLPYVGFEAKY